MKNNKEPNKKLWYEKLNFGITIMVGIFTMLGISVFGDIPLIDYQNKKEHEINNLLQKAEEYYLNEDYIKMLEVYSNEKLINNPIALLNIGVMYANGLYYLCDKEQAIFYFNKALEEGETYYSVLYLIQLYSYDDLDEIQRIIKIGCINNNKYCEKILQELYKQAEITCTTSYLIDFNKKTDEEKDEIISKLYDVVNQYKYKVATNYSYTVYNDENGEPHIDAEAKGIEERTISLFVKDYFKIDEIQMVFS